ncbi:hypothetical protein ACFYMW_21455 [Streptomyces sp. NPDC006692]|uniref:hypothetical protein n=1 Tax=Streptomyces sp. NPDC006692 TaxID=3364758 RepID=UPI003699EE36
MPDIAQPHHPDAAHHILNQASALLDAADEWESPGFAEPLTRAVGQLRAGGGALDLDPDGLAQTVAEAAGQLVTCTRIPLQKGEPNVDCYLDALCRLPRPARIGLLTAAILCVSPHLGGPQLPTPHE